MMMVRARLVSMLLWRHLSMVLASLALLYSMYVLGQMLLLEVPARHVSPAASSSSTPSNPFLAARNVFLQRLGNESGGVGEGVACPLGLPVLQVLDQQPPLAQYTACGKLFYNRVPKCGSRSLISVFKVLGRRYDVTVQDTQKPATGLNFYKNITNLKQFVRNFSSLEGPMLYTRHLHYVNFTRFNLAPPLYINVIRDPIQRLISHYYYNQYGSQSKPLATPKPRFNMSLDECVQSRNDACLRLTTIIPFFCGHDRRCRQHTPLAVQMAKRSVRESYQVVGITEDLPAFIEVLENLFPQFFFNASSVYREYDASLHQLYQTVKKPEVSAATVAMLRDHLAFEYDFYSFVKQRFYLILTKIRFLRRSTDVMERQAARWHAHFNEFWERV